MRTLQTRLTTLLSLFVILTTSEGGKIAASGNPFIDTVPAMASLAPETTCGTFTDVQTINPFYNGVQFYACCNVANGYSGQTCTNNGVGSPCFLPNTPITRGQLAKVVTLSHDYCCYIPPGAPSFVDVLPGSTFYQYIETANWYGLMDPARCDGSGCYFYPNINSNRGETARAIVKGASYPVVDAYSNAFADVGPNTQWRAEIETAYARGLASGYQGSQDPNYINPCTGQHENPNLVYFRPCEVITRGQVAKIDTNARFHHSAPYPGTFNWEQNYGGVNPGVRTIPSGYVSVDASWNPGPPISGPYNYDITAYNVRWSDSAKQWVVNNENAGQYKVGVYFYQACTGGSYFRALYFSVPNSYRFYGTNQYDCGSRMLVDNPATSITAGTAYYAYAYWTDGLPTFSYGNIEVGNVQVDTYAPVTYNSHLDWLAGDQNDLCYQNGFGMLKCP